MGGYNYSKVWSNTVREREHAELGYSMTINSSKYAKYVENEKLENEGLKELVRQYLNLENNYINYGLSDSEYRNFLELISKLLSRFKYLGIMDSEMPKCNLEFDSPADLLNQLGMALQWIDEVLKYFGYFGLDKGKNEEVSSIKTLNKVGTAKKIGLLDRIRQFRTDIYNKRNVNEYER